MNVRERTHLSYRRVPKESKCSRQEGNQTVLTRTTLQLLLQGRFIDGCLKLLGKAVRETAGAGPKCISPKYLLNVVAF